MRYFAILFIFLASTARLSAADEPIFAAEPTHSFETQAQWLRDGLRAKQRFFEIREQLKRDYPQFTIGSVNAQAPQAARDLDRESLEAFASFREVKRKIGLAVVGKELIDGLMHERYIRNVNYDLGKPPVIVDSLHGRYKIGATYSVRAADGSIYSFASAWASESAHVHFILHFDAQRKLLEAFEAEAEDRIFNIEQPFYGRVIEQFWQPVSFRMADTLVINVGQETKTLKLPAKTLILDSKPFADTDSVVRAQYTLEGRSGFPVNTPVKFLKILRAGKVETFDFFGLVMFSMNEY
jgi:hypothetical protein